MPGNQHPLRIGWLLTLCTATIAVVVAATRPGLVGLADELFQTLDVEESHGNDAEL